MADADSSLPLLPFGLQAPRTHSSGIGVFCLHNPFRIKLPQDRTAVVTRASRGIGEAIALKLAEHVAHIAFTYVSKGSAE